MRAYIITTTDSKHVGRKPDLTNYPSSLPDPELFYGVTPADVTTPQWWLDSHRKHKDNAPERVWCCNWKNGVEFDVTDRKLRGKNEGWDVNEWRARLNMANDSND